MFLLLFFTGLQLGARERISGSKVSLVVPKGFEKASQFPGFMLEAKKASIAVTGVPSAPFSEFSKAFTVSALESKGMKLLSKEALKMEAAEGVLLHVGQKAYGGEFLKWMLIFGDESGVEMIVATFPKEHKEELSEVLKKSVLSVRWQKEGEVDVFEGLGFRVSESETLKIANKMGNNLILTENGVFPVKEKGAATVVFGTAMTKGMEIVKNKKEFANLRLKQTALMSSLINIEEKPVKIGGLESYLIRARGVRRDGAGEIYIEQCVMFTKDGYHLFQAMVKSEKADRFKEDFKKILYSFKQE